VKDLTTATGRVWYVLKSERYLWDYMTQCILLDNPFNPGLQRLFVDEVEVNKRKVLDRPLGWWGH
jgi:hypothetical protein